MENLGERWQFRKNWLYPYIYAAFDVLKKIRAHMCMEEQELYDFGPKKEMKNMF